MKRFSQRVAKYFLMLFSLTLAATNFGQTNGMADICFVGDVSIDSIFEASLPEMVLTQESLIRDLPSSIDNSELEAGYMPPIFHQQYSGSCVHCAEIGYTFTYEMNRFRDVHAGSRWKDGTEEERQNLYHPFFTYNFNNKGQGDYPSLSGDGFKIIAQIGCPSFNDYYDPVLEHDYFPSSDPQPFRYWMDGSNKYISAIENTALYVGNDTLGVFKISWDSTYASLNNLKRWLVNHNSSSDIGGIAVFHTLMDSYGMDIIPLGTAHGGQRILTSWGQSGGHMMTIVGYDDNICVSGNYSYPSDSTLLSNCERGAFKVANSWGTGWGNGGYIWIPYSLMDFGTIYGNHVYTCIVSSQKEKSVFLKATINHPKRECLMLKVGKGDNVAVQTPERDTNYRVFRYQGGCFPMNGDVTNPRPIEIALDFNEMYDPEHCGKFFLSAIDHNPQQYENNIPYIDNFCLVDYRWNEVFELPSEHPCDTILNFDTLQLYIDYDLLFPFEMSESYICATNKVARRTVKIENQSIFTIDDDVHLDMYGTEAYNCKLLIEANSSLIIGDNAVITAKRGTCEIVVNGDVQIGQGVTFKAENGATLAITINGQQSVAIDGCTFSNVTLRATAGTRASASSSSVSSFSLSNCSFSAMQNQHEYALRVDGYTSIMLADNLINGLGLMSSRHFVDGILLYNCGNSGIGSQILRNTIKGCSGTGLTLYGTAANITGKNEITKCGTGVRLLNGSIVNKFVGNCGAFIASQTQHIHDNDLCEVQIYRACMPQTFRFNCITSQGTGWFVEYEDNIDELDGLCARIDLEYNNWGNHTNTQIESRFNYITNNTNGSVFDHLPKWNFGECPSSYEEEAQRRSVEADSLWEIGLYASAKMSYKEIVTLFPNTNTALNSMKKLLLIEGNDNENYSSLQQYYLSDTTIQGNVELAALAGSLANKCDEFMEHYEQAIAWYEAIIEDEETPYNDSLFATIDLGNLYLKMEVNGAKNIKGRLTQFVPKSAEAYAMQTDEALRMLKNTPRRFNSTREFPDQYWTGIVTEQPEGYVVDENGNVHIYTAEGLAWISSVSNGLNGQEVDDFNGRTVSLETNVDMSSFLWTPISERIDQPSFKGFFNGNGYVIDGLQLTKTNLYAYKAGFFGNVFEATLSNIVLRNGYFEGYGYGIGFLASQAVKSSIDHCFVECQMHGGESVPFIYSNIGTSICNSMVYSHLFRKGTNGEIQGVFVAENGIYNGDMTLPRIQNCASIIEKMDWTENCGLAGIINHGLIENCYAYIGEFVDFYGYAGGPAPRNGVTTDNMGEIYNCYYNRVRSNEGSNYYIEMNDLPAAINSGVIQDALPYTEEGRGHWKLIENINVNLQSGMVSTDDLLDALNFKADELDEETLLDWCDSGMDFENQQLPVFCNFDVTLINEDFNNFDLVALYPNPTCGLIQIEGESIAKVEVFNLLGQMIYGQQVIKSVNIDATYWNKGVYLAIITKENGVVEMKKIVLR